MVAPFLSGCDAGLDGASFGPWPCRPASRSMSLWLESITPPPNFIVINELGEREGAFAFQALDEGLYLATVSGLLPDTLYFFSPENHGGVAEPALGSFRTLPEREGILKLAVGADIHPASAPYLAFDAIARLEPHLFLGLGDHVYADLDPSGPVPATAEAYAELYQRTWRDECLHACWSNVPSILMWDDHEVWNDFDGASDRERVSIAADAYQRYQRSRSPSRDPWVLLDAGPAEIFILDTRSFRSPNISEDGPEKTMLGSEQKAALFDWLSRSSAPLKIIASPTPFHRYTDTGLDAWAHGFATERAEVFRAIDQADPKNIIIVSGDQHWPAVVEIELPSGRSIMEFMCTPTAAFTRPAPARETLLEDVLYISEGERGFGLFEISAASGAASYIFRWISEGGETRFSFERSTLG